MMDKNGALEVSIGAISTTDSRAPTINRFRIQDRASGQALVEFELDAEDLMRLLRGSHLGEVPAWIVSPELRDRIGRKLEVESLRVPKEVVAGLSGDDEKAAAIHWARTAEPEWTEYRFMTHNYGVSVTVRRWVDA